MWGQSWDFQSSGVGQDMDQWSPSSVGSQTGTIKHLRGRYFLLFQHERNYPHRGVTCRAQAAIDNSPCGRCALCVGVCMWVINADVFKRVLIIMLRMNRCTHTHRQLEDQGNSCDLKCTSSHPRSQKWSVCFSFLITSHLKLSFLPSLIYHPLCIVSHFL